MCDCCKAEGRDLKQRLGKKQKTVKARLYKVFVNKTASISLCPLCDIELFQIGESRFLKSHLCFANQLASTAKVSSDPLDDLGF
jgi:hypothetical protein